MVLTHDKVIAFMDMGTNSVRLMIVRISADQSYTILSRQKEMIRLGAGEFDNGHLQEDSMERAIHVCRKFMEMAASFNADDIVAVATSATRDAINQKEFLTRLKREAGLSIRVISGTEEARLIYLGVSSGTHVSENSLFIDIGGGSTEIIVGDEKGYQYLDSLKLGCIRITMLQLGDHKGPVSTTSYLLIQDYVRNKSIRTIQRLKDMGLKTAYGSSGTIQNLAEISCRLLHGGAPDKRELMTLTDIKQVIKHICSLPLEERQKVPGINASRADIIIGGAVILDTILSDLGIQEIRISNRELRDGLLVDYIYHIDRPIMDEMNVRQLSVLTLGRRCGFSEKHAQTVARLALELFDSARDLGLHQQDKTNRELFFYACQLHDIGTFLSYSNHHANSAYFIRNADLLGFNQDELNTIAATAFFHRRGIPGDRIRDLEDIDERIMEIVKKQFLFVRIAESLDRSHSAVVESVRFSKGKTMAIHLEIKSSRNCELEIWGVQNHCDTFEKIFGRPLEIVHIFK